MLRIPPLLVGVNNAHRLVAQGSIHEPNRLDRHDLVLIDVDPPMAVLTDVRPLTASIVERQAEEHVLTALADVPGAPVPIQYEHLVRMLLRPHKGRVLPGVEPAADPCVQLAAAFR